MILSPCEHRDRYCGLGLSHLDGLSDGAHLPDGDGRGRRVPSRKTRLAPLAHRTAPTKIGQSGSMHERVLTSSMHFRQQKKDNLISNPDDLCYRFQQ